MKTPLTFIAAALLSACAQGTPVDGVVFLDIEPELVEAEPEGTLIESTPELPPAFDPCVAVVTPEPELYDWAVASVDAWAQALPMCIVAVGDGGIPVRAVPQVVKEDGSTAYAVTTRLRIGELVVGIKEILISDEAPNRHRSLRHEFGHLLGAEDHTISGLMSSDGSMVIDEPSRALVCAAIPGCS